MRRNALLVKRSLNEKFEERQGFSLKTDCHFYFILSVRVISVLENSGGYALCTVFGGRPEIKKKKELRKRRLIHRGSIVYGTICNIVNCKVCTQGRTAPMLRPGLKWKVAPFSLKKSEQNFNFCTLVRPPLWCARGKPTQLLPPSFWAALCVRYFITAFMSTTVCHHLFLIYFI